MEGAVVGFIGIVLLFLILNRILRGLRLELDGQLVSGISVLSPAIWNTLLLAALFGIQHLMEFIPLSSTIIHQMLSGFISTFTAVFLTLIFYQAIGKILPWSRIKIKTTTLAYTITRFSVLQLAIMAGIYEAIALPVILIWQDKHSHPVLIAALTGFLGGILGSGIMLLCYNYLKFPRIHLLMAKHPRTNNTNLNEYL